MTPYDIVARIYEMLGACSREDLLITAKAFGVTPEVRRAILSLARAKERFERSVPSSRHREPNNTSREVNHLAYSDSEGDLANTLKTLIFSEAIFPRAADAADFFNRVGVGFKLRGANGRRPIYDKALRGLMRMSPEARAHKIDLIHSQLPISQTSGWMNVIRGG